MQLNQVTVACQDYRASVEFYLRIGLVQIVDAPPRYARFEAPDGRGATLSIHANQNTVSKSSVIYFDHDNKAELNAHMTKLRAAGERFMSTPRDEEWGWREARLLDPSGNEICLVFAGPMRRFPPWRIR